MMGRGGCDMLRDRLQGMTIRDLLGALAVLGVILVALLVLAFVGVVTGLV